MRSCFYRDSFCECHDLGRCADDILQKILKFVFEISSSDFISTKKGSIKVQCARIRKKVQIREASLSHDIMRTGADRDNCQ